MLPSTLLILTTPYIQAPLHCYYLEQILAQLFLSACEAHSIHSILGADMLKIYWMQPHKQLASSVTVNTSNPLKNHPSQEFEKQKFMVIPMHFEFSCKKFICFQELIQYFNSSLRKKHQVFPPRIAGEKKLVISASFHLFI